MLNGADSSVLCMADESDESEKASDFVSGLFVPNSDHGTKKACSNGLAFSCIFMVDTAPEQHE